MADQITLPGSIPGLLRRGAPVVLTRDVRRGSKSALAGYRGVVTDVSASGVPMFYIFGYTGAFPLDAVALDLADEVGCDIAARWVYGKVAHGPMFVRSRGTGGVNFTPTTHHGPGCWHIAGPQGFCAPDAPHRDPSDTVVPGLVGVTDPRLALRAVVLHLAGLLDLPPAVEEPTEREAFGGGGRHGW